MQKKMLLILLSILITVPLHAAGGKESSGKIDFLLGKVSVMRSSGQFMDAKLNMKIQEGDKVITKQNSSAQVLLGKDVKIRIAANSEFELKKDRLNEANEKETVLGLTFGKIWTSIAKLGKNEKFSIETPTAVAGVRGTIFVMKETEQGSTLYVGAGVVNFFSKLLNKEVNVDKGFMITLGPDGKLGESRQMTDKDMQDMMSGIPVFFKQGKGLKSELKDEINNEKGNLEKQRDMTAKLKSDDLTAGRTLRDIHGNVVRVEQMFRKKDKLSFQILNITKRADGIAYFDFTAIFNKELPDNFKNWGEFFQQDDVEMSRREIIMGAKKAAGEDVFKWTGEYDPVADKFKDSYTVNGKAYTSKTGNFDEDVIEVESSEDQLQSLSKLELTEKDNPSVTRTLNIRMAVINNNGQVLSSKYFESSGNVLNIFNSMAGEIILSSSDLLKGDIDIVAIPDIMFVLIQETF
ncbi:MAG: FecR family protein [bacterium]|nr:FecR family protein [bacterium]